MLPSEALPQRGLSAYLRALWNLDLSLWPTPLSANDAGVPFVSTDGVHLPASHPFQSDWYRAAAAHAAAHRVYSRHVFDGTGLAPITRALVGMLEDARVEWLACRELPGLRRLWLAHHTVALGTQTDSSPGFEALVLRLARSLLDPHCTDDHAWVRKGRALFFLDVDAQAVALTQPDALRRAASILGNDIGQMRLSFNAKLYRPGPSYRDDNRVLWRAHEGQSDAAPDGHDPAPETGHRRLDPAPPESVTRYREWDRLISRYRADWCSVHEVLPSHHRQPNRPDRPTTAQSPSHSALVRLVRPVRRALQAHPDAASPLHALARQGSRMDLNALVRWAVDARCFRNADARIYRAHSVARPRTSWSVLIDASASSGTEAGFSSLTLSVGAAEVAAAALNQMGSRQDEIAVQSFCSDGRHAVFMTPLKRFAAAWDVASLSTLRAGLSTRLGAALRHATAGLAKRPNARRILLLLSDGEPHDVDVHDPRYLVDDARRAVMEARQRGVRVVCIQIAANQQSSANAVFHRPHRAHLNRIEALPKALRQLRL